MKRGRRIVYFGIGLMLLVSSMTVTTKADEISELKQLLNEQTKKLQELQERIAQLEARQRLKERSLTEKIELVEKKQKETPPPSLPDNLKWAEKIKLSGDFRYRHETIDAEGDDKGTRNRDRIRARLRLDAQVNDEFDAIFRLATAENDGGFASGSTSTNVTLDREFRQKNIWLDWAYGNYHPEHMQGLNVLFGKMPGPVQKVGENQIIYDNDLAWEGGALNYKLPLNDKQEMFINGGGFWLNEVDGVDTSADASLWAIQTGLNHEIDSMSLTYGASYYHFGNADQASLTLGSSSGFDNTYNIVEGFAEVGTKIGELPFSVYASYANNTGTHSSADTAWIVGATFNKAKDPGSWELGYNYRDVEADSVAGRLNDSDFIGGGSGGEGHEFKAAYQIHKNVKAGLTYILAERDRSSGSDLDYDRLMLDLILKF